MQIMLKLDWAKNNKGEWYSFEAVDLADEHFKGLSGVYIVFYMDGVRPITVRLGQGNIAERIGAHRNDDEITDHNGHDLLVTWAKVSAKELDGVERFLKERLGALVGDRFPEEFPLPVSLPFQPDSVPPPAG